MAGISLQAFADWVANTGPQFLTGDRNIINDVSRRSFILGKFLRDKKASKVLRGSNRIQETVYLSPNRTAVNFNRNEDVTWENPQKDVVMEYDFKFTVDHMSWDEAEYLMQSGAAGPDGLKTKYKDMAWSKEQRLWESNLDFIETRLWYPPGGNLTDTTEFAAMETDQNGKDQLSIPVFINENAGSTTGSFNNAWTAVGGIDWVTYGASNGNADNKRTTYDATNEADFDDGLFAGFDDISIEIGYETPGFKDQYFETESSYGDGQTTTPHIICCSKAGKKMVMRLNRNSNDSLITPQDAAYPMPRWNGVPIKDVLALDSAALYIAQDATAFVSEEAAGGTTATNVNASGPRFYFMNCDYLYTVFHKAKYFRKRKVKEPENKVGVYVIPVETWWNLVCTSRRRQGLVYPA